VDIELHQAFVSHFQQEGLASLFIRDIGAFHDIMDAASRGAHSGYFLDYAAQLDSYRHQPC
jgi:hypothetical protein